MLNDKCCVCNEEVKSPYGYIQHLDNGKSRQYTGHKGCLFSIPLRLEKGEELRYSEFVRPTIK